MEAIPKPFLIIDHEFGNVTGGNIDINLPPINNSMVINSFPTRTIMNKYPSNVLFPRKIKR